MQNNNPLGELSLQQLQQVVAIREKIEDLEKELDRMVGGRQSIARAAAPRRRRRRVSAAARAKLSASMKAKWAKRKGKTRATRLASAKETRRSSGTPLKEQILGTLMSAGKSGMTVKDIAKKLGKSYGNISVWFHTTAKGIKEIRKVAPGRFAWAG
jgi:hypothetical protein